MKEGPDTVADGQGSSERGRGARLDSWKEIAAYLNRDVRTVQRWEKTAALPVRRLQKPGLRAVYAYVADLDEWRRDQDPSTVDGDIAAAASSPAVVEESPQEAAPRRGWRSATLIALVAFVPIAIAAAALALRGREAEPAPFGPFQARPITSEPGNERDPSFSADGRYIAYVSEAPGGTTSLVVRMVETGDARTLAAGGAGEIWSPAWSPDGARIAFLRGDPADTTALVLTPVLGGAERSLATVRPYPQRRSRLGHLLTWTPDGRFIIAADQVSPGTGSLVRIAVDTGDRTPITSPGDSQYDVEPSLSSDGRLLLFSRVRTEFLSDVYVQPLDATFQPSGSARPLPGAGSWNGTPRLLETRHEVLTSAGALPRLSLWRQPVDGRGTPVPVGIIGDSAVQSAVSGDRIVVRTFRSGGDVLRFPLAPRGPGQDAPQVTELAQSTYVDVGAAYSPDGSAVAFISDRSGSRQLWVTDADGNAPIEWTQTFEADVPMPAWSPDGSRLAFAGLGPSGNTQLFVADRQTRKAVRLTEDERSYERPAWSPDGSVIYAAAAEKGVYALYRLPSTGGAATRVATGYSRAIGVAPDGQGIYAVRPAAAGPVGPVVLEYVPLPAGTAVPIARMGTPDDGWMAPAGLYILERRTDASAPPVALIFRTHAGAVTTLAEYPAAPGRGLSVSPDGRFGLTTRATPASADLLLLEPAR